MKLPPSSDSPAVKASMARTMAMPPEAIMTATGYATTMRLNRPGLGRSWWPPMAAPKS